MAPLNREYAWEVYAVRSAIESLAAEIVAPRLTDDDLSELRAIAVPHEPKPDGDYSEMFGPDLGLHDYIRLKCPLAFVNAADRLSAVPPAGLLHLEHSLDAAYRKASYEEHCAIVEALERRDGKAARRLMQEHLDRVGAAVAALAE